MLIFDSLKLFYTKLAYLWLAAVWLSITACNPFDSNNGDVAEIIPPKPTNNTEALIQYMSLALKGATGVDVYYAEVNDTVATTTAPSETSQNNEQEAGVNEGDRQLNDGTYLHALSVNNGVNPRPQLMTWQLNRLPSTDETTASTVQAMGTPASLELPEYHQELFKYDDNLVSLNKPHSWWFWRDAFYVNPQKDQYVGLQWYTQADSGGVNKSDYWKIEGRLVRSLKVGTQLISVIKYTPVISNLPYQYPANTAQTNANFTYLSNHLTLGNLSPDWSINGVNQGELADASQCKLTAGDNVDHYQAQIIYLVTSDMSNPKQKPQVSCAVGNIETVYGSTNALYLSSTDYYHAISSVAGSAVSSAAQAMWIPPQYNTQVHRFAITDTGTQYTASAKVEGLIPGDAKQKAFRFSERDANHLAVVSYVGNSQASNTSRVKLTILGLDDAQTTFSEVGSLPNAQEPESIGKPGELLYATRFTDEYAYIVTFDKTDPLYAISLADLSAPTKISELEITGFSDYLHPLTDTSYLVGVGHEATPADTFQTASGGFSWFLGVKLSLFKQDGEDLSESSKIEVGKRGSNTPVLNNHHAFTFLKATDDRPFRFALPVNIHNTQRDNNYGNASIPAYYDWTESVVQLYQVAAVTDTTTNTTSHTLQLMATLPLAKRSESTGSAYQYAPSLSNTRTVMSAERLWVLYQNQLLTQAITSN